MSKISVMTDSNSGITQKQAADLGVKVLPMPFLIDGETYFEDINLTHEEFYKRLKQDVAISTSQPSPEAVMQAWEELLEESDSVVYIPMSSGLSGSCQTAKLLAQEYDGRVQVVDNQRISVTQSQAVKDAKELCGTGMTAEEIKDYLEQVKFDSSIYIMLDTLKYLRKGGRITPAAAALGSALRLKPVLQIQGEKLDAFSKVRTMSAAKRVMLDAIRSDLEKRFGGCRMRIDVAHTNNEGMALEFKKEIEAEFPEYPVMMVNELSLSVACHIGDGALAIACSKIVEV